MGAQNNEKEENHMAQFERILIAEDSKQQGAELVELLKGLGFQDITLVTTAHDAIRVAIQNRPDAVFIDGLLPGMHGFEVSRFIRGIDPNYHPRIVLTTAIYKNTRYQNEAKLKYGVDAYVVKPVTAESLARAVFMEAAA
jgi:CheY-like chemotaxis protein